VCVARLLLTRDDEETYSLSLLFGAAVQYVVFKQGADIHIFWSIYFAPYYALALAQLVHTFGWVFGWLVGRFARTRAWRAPTVAYVTLALGILPPLVMAHDGVASLWVWRRTGGRYDDNGSLIRNGIDLLEVVEQVLMPATKRGTWIATNPSSGWGWEHQWKWQGPNNDVGLPVSGSRSPSTPPFWIGRGSGMMADIQKKVIAAGHVRVYGDTWIVDQRENIGPIDAYSVVEREPNAWEWLLMDGTEPRRTCGKQPDPWLTWEYRTHLGQDAFEPTAQPVTLDEIRIAHNIAVAKHDAAAVEKWRELIDAAIDRTVTVKYEPWARLVGVRRIDGVQPRVEAWFEVTDEPAGDAQFDVTSTVQAKARFSLIPVTMVERSMSFPPSLPTKLWRVGFLYKLTTVLNHRIGVEHYTARWSSRDGSPAPHRTDRGPDVTLAVVE
jgi:hypothetical protein